MLDPAAARRGPIPNGKPSWVQCGPYEAVAIAREGNTITATLDVPADLRVRRFPPDRLYLRSGRFLSCVGNPQP